MSTPQPSTLVRRATLPNGLVVVTEEMPHARTAAVALAQRHGSRDETAEESGLSHFLEHFLFRGTLAGGPGGGPLSGHDIAVQMDLLGGEVDASTHRESTCYSAECVSDLLPRATELLAALVARPALPAADFEKERAVIREEIRGYEESMSDRTAELALGSFWPEHPLSRPIEGTRATLAAFTRDGLADFWRRHCAGANLVVTAAGAVQHDAFVEQVVQLLGDLPAGSAPVRPVPPAPVRHAVVRRREHLEQAHVLFSMPGLRVTDAELPALTLLATALGGGMSSRLWMRIREDEGLAYDVACAHSAFTDAGRLAFSVVAAPENVRRALALFHEECASLARASLAASELERAFQYVRGGLLLGLESPGARAIDQVGAELAYGRPMPAEEHLARLRAVTPDQVLELARRIFARPERGLVVLGPRSTPALGDGDLGA